MEMRHIAFHFSNEDMEIGDSIYPKLYDGFTGMKAGMEESLERVRINDFPNYNTRLYCVFLAPTKESALEWCREINIVHWRNEQKEVCFFLYSVELQEKPMWYDSTILTGFYFPNNEKDSISEAYWKSGNTFVEPHTTRTLEYMTAKEVVIIDKTKWKITTDGEIIEDR